MVIPTIPTTYRLAGCGLLILSVSCVHEHAGDPFVAEAGSAAPEEWSDAPAWEEYRDGARQLGGEDGYVVEGDLRFSTLEELRAYYENTYLRTIEKAAVNTLSGSYDTWDFSEQVRLRYCVDSSALTGFGSDHSEVAATMEEATRAWEEVANVYFTYVPSENSNCRDAADKDRVTFGVTRGTTCYAFSPFPSQIRNNKNTGIPQYTNMYVFWSALTTQRSDPGCFPLNLLTKVGVLKHELGHVLGLVHEHLFASPPVTSPDCSGDSSAAEQLTPYDQVSIMHYPYDFCRGNGTTVLEELTLSDGIGARALYGAPARWFPAWGFPMIFGN